LIIPESLPVRRLVGREFLNLIFMLNIKIKILNDKIAISGLTSFINKAPAAVKRGLTASALGVFREAFRWLSGSGAKKSNIAAGGYPVPVRTGHLRRMLAWLKPGETKSADGQSFTAGPFESVVYDSAEYADVIHEGKGSSAKYGPRRYIDDALETFNRGDRIKRNIESEINRIKPK